MNAPSIEQLVAAQRRFFASGQTLDLAFRKQSLLTLKHAIRAHEEAVNAALMQDLGKSAAETYMCETGMTLSELSYMISHLGRFAKKRPRAHPAGTVSVGQLHRPRALRRGADYGAVELSLHAADGTADRRAGGGQLLHAQAVGLRARHVEGHRADCRRVLPARIRRAGRRRPRGKSGAAASAV